MRTVFDVLTSLKETLSPTECLAVTVRCPQWGPGSPLCTAVLQYWDCADCTLQASNAFANISHLTLVHLQDHISLVRWMMAVISAVSEQFVHLHCPARQEDQIVLYDGSLPGDFTHFTSFPAACQLVIYWVWEADRTSQKISAGRSESEFIKGRNPTIFIMIKTFKL